MSRPSAAVSYGRLLRPFPVRRLHEITYYVRARAGSIQQRVNDLQIDQPTDPDRWVFELQGMLGDLYTLSEQIGELVPKLIEMQDDADRAYSVAVDAMLACLRGLQLSGEPPGPVDGVEAAEAAAA